MNCTSVANAGALNCELKLSDGFVSLYAAVPSLAAIAGALVGEPRSAVSDNPCG